MRRLGTGEVVEIKDQKKAVDLFRQNSMDYTAGILFRKTVKLELRGKDLACWCPLDGPCHADVLLEIANA